jgi:L-seryl-tRNA(Ser) seleniumtransferase
VTLRVIPSIEQMWQRPAFRPLEQAYGRAAVIDAIRAEAQTLRERLSAGTDISRDSGDVASSIEEGARRRLETERQPSLASVINATGVVIHTNLGRAPLARAAVERIAALATGYSNLEYDLGQGQRGRRDIHAERAICRLTGAGAAVIVNNNAAATLLVLAALAAGREVIVSRGELVEIGGGFRVPDVMAQSGAVLREVGTTNRTRAADYAAAIGDRTALILRVHPSNFRIEGFTERPAVADLVSIGRRFNVPVVEDLGSGLLTPATDIAALRDEPSAAESLAAGVAVVMFSGDKLLGGPQAGIIAGDTESLTRVRRHPLMRALRADKMTYAALEATLDEIAAGRAPETVPVTRMLSMSIDAIRQRAALLVDRLAHAGIEASIVDGTSAVGGGSAPGALLPTRLVAIAAPAERLEAALRRQAPPVIARIDSGRVIVDLRTVDPAADETVASLIAAAAGTLNVAP